MELNAQDQERASPVMAGSDGQLGGTPSATTAASTVHDVLESAASGTGEAHDKVKQVVSRVPHAAQAPLYEAVHAAADAGVALIERGQELADAHRGAADSMTRYVRTNPLQSVGLAFAAGWLIGRLTR